MEGAFCRFESKGMQGMYCAKCGNQLPDDALFCTKCGAKVNIGDQHNRNTSNMNGMPGRKLDQKAKLSRILIGVGIGAVAALVLIVGIVVAGDLLRAAANGHGAEANGAADNKSASIFNILGIGVEPYNHETSNFRVAGTPTFTMSAERPRELGNIAYYDGYTYYVEDILEVNNGTAEGWKGSRIKRVSDKSTEPELLLEREGETLCYLTFFGDHLYALGNDGKAGWSFNDGYAAEGDPGNTTKVYSVYMIDPEKGTLELQEKIEGVGGSGIISEDEEGYYFQTFCLEGNDGQRDELVIFHAANSSVNRIDLGEWRDWRFPLGVYRKRAYYARQDGNAEGGYAVVSYDLSGKDERIVYQSQESESTLNNICDTIGHMTSRSAGTYDGWISFFSPYFIDNELNLAGLKIDLTSGNLKEEDKEWGNELNYCAGTDGEALWMVSLNTSTDQYHMVIKSTDTELEVEIPEVIYANASIIPLPTIAGVWAYNLGYGGAWIYLPAITSDLLSESSLKDEMQEDEILDDLKCGFYRISKETGEADFIPTFEGLMEEVRSTD